MSKKPEIAVIISTYNSVEWLKKTLWGYAYQSYPDFELIIADDGSNEITRKVILEFSVFFKRKIIHVWHPDNGFQKSAILNKAIIAATAEYILMSDGDCIPKKDFVQTHLDLRKPNYFLSGGYLKLPMDISHKIDKNDIESGLCFDVTWLESQGLKKSFKNKKLSAKIFERKILNFITPTNASWNGHNSSGWKKDIIKVNGFDERMQYGGQDRELGERLINSGVKSKQIRYSTTCLHLDHERGYKTPESLSKNAKIREKTRQEKLVFTPFGINK